ncbi:unnamed protein product [Pieris macdunnoughi]|uniref:Uncharacterized protein n=1 Tax=Pieris macdunnoughi TaxID=345717 RepID=A0A821VYU2_9NEOP|nr:unnamed protein product [Pieris macdunnoughi]
MSWICCTLLLLMSFNISVLSYPGWYENAPVPGYYGNGYPPIVVKSDDSLKSILPLILLLLMDGGGQGCGCNCDDGPIPMPFPIPIPINSPVIM